MGEKGELVQVDYKPVDQMTDQELQDLDRDYHQRLLDFYAKAEAGTLTAQEYHGIDALKTLLHGTQGEMVKRMSEGFASLSEDDLLQKRADLMIKHREAFEARDLEACDAIDTESKAVQKALETQSNERLMREYTAKKKK